MHTCGPCIWSKALAPTSSEWVDSTIDHWPLDVQSGLSHPNAVVCGLVEQQNRLVSPPPSCCEVFGLGYVSLCWFRRYQPPNACTRGNRQWSSGISSFSISSTSRWTFRDVRSHLCYCISKDRPLYYDLQPLLSLRNEVGKTVQLPRIYFRPSARPCVETSGVVSAFMTTHAAFQTKAHNSVTSTSDSVFRTSMTYWPAEFTWSDFGGPPPRDKVSAKKSSAAFKLFVFLLSNNGADPLITAASIRPFWPWLKSAWTLRVPKLLHDHSRTELIALFPTGGLRHALCLIHSHELIQSVLTNESSTATRIYDTKTWWRNKHHFRRQVLTLFNHCGTGNWLTTPGLGGTIGATWTILTPLPQVMALETLRTAFQSADVLLKLFLDSPNLGGLELVKNLRGLILMIGCSVIC